MNPHTPERSSGMGTIYGLLVGIDDYPPAVPKLQGCVNDVLEMQQYLESRVERGESRLEDVLKLRVLVNHEASREVVIRDFRAHLGQAGAGEVALFCYSGHGSQEPA